MDKEQLEKQCQLADDNCELMSPCGECPPKCKHFIPWTVEEWNEYCRDCGYPEQSVIKDTSSCCQAPVKIVAEPEDCSSTGVTHYYACSKCNRPCNLTSWNTTKETH